MKIDLFFLIVLGFVVAYIFMLHKVETMADVGSTDQIKAAVKEIYLADVEAIRNLSNVATKLQAGGLTMPGQLNIISDSNHIQLKTKNDDTKNIYLTNTDGHFRLNTHGVGDMFGVNKDGHHYVRHTGDHVMHVEGDGYNPYISLGKTGTWDKKKLYIQNVEAHTENPTFRVGIHSDRMLMNMNKSHGVYWPRKDGRNTHFDWEDSKNYIRGDTQHDNTLTVGELRLRNGNWTEGAADVDVFLTPDFKNSKFQGMKMCPAGSYVCGLDAQYEPTCGSCDDTGMTGIRMKCCKF